MGILLGAVFIGGEPSEDLPFFMSSMMGLAIVVGAILLAVILCGMIAILAEIERHLREMKVMPPYGSARAGERNIPPKL